MKVVSDFDGVLTTISDEASRVSELFTRYLSEFALIADRKVSALLTSLDNEFENSPFQFGWHWKNRISAFCNEDGFIRVNAMAHALDQRIDSDPDLTKGKSILAAFGMKTFQDIAQRAYVDMTQETAKGKHKPIEKEAIAALSYLISQGAKVVVVSNSATDRIEQLLTMNGMTVGYDSSSPLRVRGNAGKFILGDSPRLFSLGAANVDTDRPGYESILLEEKPDHVFGDVFSLDLALPLFLKRQAAEGLKSTRVWLKLQPYTPSWSRKLFSSSINNASFIKESEGGTFQSFDTLMASQALRP